MIKIIVSEMGSPIDSHEATDLSHSSAVRAINLDPSKVQVVSIVDTTGTKKSISLSSGESVILKKQLQDKVYASSKSVRIAGVSIY